MNSFLHRFSNFDSWYKTDNNMKSFSRKVRIRYSDIDMNHHVNNAVYFSLMENARTELLMEDFIHYQQEKIAFIVAEASCKYKRPILLTDNIDCEMTFDLAGPLRINVAYRFVNNDNGQLHALGNTVLVMINESNNRPIAIPDRVITKLVKQ